MRKTEILTLSLPPQLLKNIKKVTRQENLNQSELIRNALRFYLKERQRWQQIRKWGQITKDRFKIKDEEDIEEIIDQVRK